MRRLALLPLLVAALVSGRAAADPGVTVYYFDGLLRVTLDGWYGGSYYQVWRSGELVGVYDPIQSEFTLCTGDCFLTDLQAVPGKTYYYRFDLVTPSGARVSYGPYAVAVPDTPFGVQVWPNPSHGVSLVRLSVPGSSRWDAPVPAEAAIIDLQGRAVKRLYSGPLVRGVTPVAWDGRDDSGRQVGAGVFFVRVTTPMGTLRVRFVRTG